jgi:hypothetical protein
MPFMAKVTGVNPSTGLDSSSYVVSVEIRSPALSASIVLDITVQAASVVQASEQARQKLFELGNEIVANLSGQGSLQ